MSVNYSERIKAGYQRRVQGRKAVNFLMLVLTLLLNMLARFLVWRVARKTPQEARV